MQITVELPDDITQHPDPGREALERLAIEGYRSGALTHHQAGQLLGLSRFEFDEFLQETLRVGDGYMLSSQRMCGCVPSARARSLA